MCFRCSCAIVSVDSKSVAGDNGEYPKRPQKKKIHIVKEEL